VTIAVTEKLPGSTGTSVPRKLGMLPDRRTVRMLPANPVRGYNDGLFHNGIPINGAAGHPDGMPGIALHCLAVLASTLPGCRLDCQNLKNRKARHLPVFLKIS